MRTHMARPTKYKDEFAEQARKLCLLGATDAELAGFFEVSERTINDWKKRHAEFLQSLKAGKRIADAEVADKLHQRATGYRWVEQHAFKVRKDANLEEIEVVDVERETPPDPTSMIFWLKNRDPERWRDKPAEAGAGDDMAAALTKIADSLPG